MRLFEIVTGCDDLQGYVEASAKLIGCPYWIMDSGFSLIAISHHPDALKVYNRFVKKTSVIDSIERWEKHGVFADQNHKVPMTFYDELLETRVMILDIFTHHEAIGRMTIILENDVAQDLAVEVAAGASVYLRTTVNDYNRDTYHQAFASLLRGEDTETCARVLGEAPLFLMPPYQVICIGEENRNVLFAYAKYINDIDEKLIPVVTGGCLYALASKGHPFEHATSKISAYQHSFPFSDLTDMRSFGMQARFAFEQKQAIEDCYIAWLTQIIEQQVSLDSLILPEVKACIAYDEEYHTAYFETLRTYIQCGFSKQAAAKEMNVHLNTIKYRIQQMKSLFDIDFDQKKTALTITSEIFKQMKKD